MQIFVKGLTRTKITLDVDDDFFKYNHLRYSGSGASGRYELELLCP